MISVKIAISRKFENIPSVSSPIGYLWNCLDKSHQPPILPWFNGEIPTLLESNHKILMKFWTTPAKFLVIFHAFPNIFSFSSDGIHWNPPDPSVIFGAPRCQSCETDIRLGSDLSDLSREPPPGRSVPWRGCPCRWFIENGHRNSGFSH